MPKENMNAFEAFIRHNRTAAKEANKAAMGLLPQEFWDHSKNAIEESVQGFAVVVGAAVQGARKSYQRTKPQQEPEPKRKVEVEIE